MSSRRTEAELLLALRQRPGNEELRRELIDRLEADGDERADFLRAQDRLIVAFEELDRLRPELPEEWQRLAVLELDILLHRIDEEEILHLLRAIRQLPRLERYPTRHRLEQLPARIIEGFPVDLVPRLSAFARFPNCRIEAVPRGPIAPDTAAKRCESIGSQAPSSEEGAFLRSLAENPGDRVARLVYADWLDEKNDPRANYLRVQDELAETFLLITSLRFDPNPEWLEVASPRRGLRLRSVDPGRHEPVIYRIREQIGLDLESAVDFINQLPRTLSRSMSYLAAINLRRTLRDQQADVELHPVSDESN